ncbi:class I lanthipeptide [Taibaiella helva]|uniref:class I lanthipeptide n=1 Tax=Taibaiella helva TaxID=2301235 RepID=UPI00130058F8|nr:class I lanthipeptide [Taibaiella helva]
MKKKTLLSNKKLTLNKHVITDLSSLSMRLGGGDPPYQSLQCPSMNCTAAVCDPNGSVGCQSVFQCPGGTTPGVNGCVLEEKPSLRIVCPPTPVTTNCTLDGCHVSQ